MDTIQAFYKVLLILSLLLVTKTVQADTIPLPGAAGFAEDGQGSQVYGPALGSVSGSGADSLNNTFTDSASSTLVNGDPTVQATGTGAAWAQAALVYNYEIIGPAATSIPVILTGTVSASVSEVSGVTAEAQINPGSSFATTGPILLECAEVGTAGCSGGTQTASISFNVSANSIQSIYMIAQINALGISTSSSFQAFADPTLIIDPSFAQASSYTISFSPGVSAVPLPTSSSMLLCGILLITGFSFRATRQLKSA
jgi:hypothetical protein